MDIILNSITKRPEAGVFNLSIVVGSEPPNKSPEPLMEALSGIFLNFGSHTPILSRQFLTARASFCV
jgi:hypothetical protein